MKNSDATGEQLFIWDSEQIPPVMADWTSILWRRFADGISPREISIPKLIEENAAALKASYLSWIYNLGELRINGQRVVDRLEIRSGFSYWWMTHLVEKCNYSKSPQITVAFRLLAFALWATGRTFDRVILASDDARLAKCIRLWCSDSGLKFEWQRLKVSRAEPKTFLKRCYHRFPYSFQALFSLGYYLFHRWPLRDSGRKAWRETTGQLTFISYFFNLDPDAAKEGCFKSRYWAHLPDNLQQEGVHTNWLHLYVKDGLHPSAKKAAIALKQFNITGKGSQIHVTLDSFLSPRIVLKVLFDAFRLSVVSRGLRKTLACSRVSSVNLWPLFDEEWLNALKGSAALMNLLFFHLFESAINELPKQRAGVYLQENQAWEFACVRAWKHADHGLLIGTPHSTVRYWDLRYFFDSRSYRRTGMNNLPLPDKVALNGVAALDEYLKGGYPEADCVEVEALRYIYLSDFTPKSERVMTPSKVVLHVLVLGDYLQSNTRKQMRLLEQAVPLMHVELTITVKPHPNCPIVPEDYPHLRMNVTMAPIWTLVAACDVAYTSNATSAAVDAYCMSVPVVSVLDSDDLNQNPLRGRKGVFFAGSPKELADVLISASSSSISNDGKSLFFTLDPGLPRWRTLLLNSPTLC